jgi:hypothetical protein
MKTLLATSAIVLLCSVPSFAQDTKPDTGTKNDNTIHQSAGDRDSRGTPKYHQSSRNYHHYRHHRYHRYAYRTHRGPSGVRYENSIHQSAGDRDSRGNPK